MTWDEAISYWFLTAPATAVIVGLMLFFGGRWLIGCLERHNL